MHAKSVVTLDANAASNGRDSPPNKQWLEKEKQAEHVQRMVDAWTRTVLLLMWRIIQITGLPIFAFHVFAPPDWHWLPFDRIYTLIPLTFKLFAQGGTNNGGTGVDAL